MEQAITEIIGRYRKHETLTDDEIVMLSSWLSESAEREAWFTALQEEEYLQVEPQANITAGGKWELWNQYNERYNWGKEVRTGLKLLVSSVVVVIAMICFAPAYFICRLDASMEQCSYDMEPGKNKAMQDTGDVCRFKSDGKSWIITKGLNWSIVYLVEAPYSATYSIERIWYRAVGALKRRRVFRINEYGRGSVLVKLQTIKYNIYANT